MNRREFVLGGAAASTQGKDPPLRIAFLGGGHGHGSAKADTVRQSPDWELAGICEDDPAVRDAYARRGVPLLTRRQVLDDSSIRVIAVESFVPELAAGAKAALEAGKHIHLDKPPSASMEDFRAVLDLAARNRRLVQVGYMWRYNPAINRALEAARAGWLGDVFQLRGCINTSIPAAERRKLAQFMGGQMFELGGHLIDPMVRLMGRPERVTPYLRRDSRAEDGLADNTIAVFEWDRAIGTVVTASMQPRAFAHRALEIVGTRGTATVNPIEPPSLHIDLDLAAGPYKAGAQNLTFAYRRYVDDFAELAAAVRGERKLEVTPGEDLLVEEALLRAGGMAV
jgi:predicted dehydrogenase